jgi:hypothetical protein
MLGFQLGKSNLIVERRQLETLRGAYPGRKSATLGGTGGAHFLGPEFSLDTLPPAQVASPDTDRPVGIEV